MSQHWSDNNKGATSFSIPLYYANFANELR